jgi:hypothetical protein
MSSEKIKCDEQKLYDNTYITQGQLNKLKRGKMSSEKQSSCHECNYDEGTNLLKYDQSIYYLCDDCYEEHMKEEE